MPFARVLGPGHPDRVCDLLCATLVEAYLRRDVQARTRLCATGGRESVFLDGDIVSTADFDALMELKQVLASVDPAITCEPFLTCESVDSELLPAAASAETCIVHGYATADTASGWPFVREQARSFVQALEMLRVQDPNGFVIGSDYELLADERKKELLLRLDYVPADQRTLLETCLTSLRTTLLDGWTLRLARGLERGGGLRRRAGMSGRGASIDQTSSPLPSNVSGVGFAPRHPFNLGTWLARQEALRLVREGKGRGVLLALLWKPFETRPEIVSLRNERGDDLRSASDAERFDLMHTHVFLEEEPWLVKTLRAEWEDIALPWES